jgi:hypothetical protein
MDEDTKYNIFLCKIYNDKFIIKKNIWKFNKDKFSLETFKTNWRNRWMRL